MKPESWKTKFLAMSIGQVFSIIGSSVAQFAIIWWLTVETGSAITLTVASFMGYLPQALMGPFIGVWADRLDRKKIMMLSDSFIALTSAFLAIMFALDAISLWMIYLVLALRSFAGAFHFTAYRAVIPTFVPPDKLVQAGGWGELVSSGSSLIGPVLGALMMSVTSLEVIMLVDIVGAALAVGTLFFIKIARVQARQQKNVWQDLKDGLITLRDSRMVMKFLTLSIVFVCVLNSTFSLIPLLVAQHYGGNAWHNSAVQVALSAGVLLGAGALGVWGGGKRQFFMLALATLGICLSLSAGGLLPSNMILLFVGLMFFTGACTSIINVPTIALLQRTIPADSIGKVTGLIMSVRSVVIPLGLAVAGPAAEFLGVAAWFVIAGVVSAVAGIYFLAKSGEFDRHYNSLDEVQP